MSLTRNGLLTLSIAAVTLLLSVYLLAGGLKGFRTQAVKSISVTGKAERTFTSDLIVWTATITTEDTSLSSAYSELKEKQTAVASYLQSKQIPAEAITYSSVNISKQTRTHYDSENNRLLSSFVGYELTQTVTISSQDIEAIETVSRQISELINQGIEIESGTPRYYYSKLNELKIEMLKEASQDARQRASVIADGGGRSLGKLQRSSMGVFQIVGEHSDEDFSWGGSFNTSSKVKTASITVSSTYAIN